MKRLRLLVTAILVSFMGLAAADPAHFSFLPGERVLLDAHNCYPYGGMWLDRIDRALASGMPLSIEIDLGWYADPATGEGRLVVSHGDHMDGREPTLREYFFDRVRPIIENALAEGPAPDWPLITLNINDIRAHTPEAWRAGWDLLREHEAWLTTAVKAAPPDPVAPLDVKPVLLLTSGGRAEVEAFYDGVPIGGKLLAFGGGSDDRPATNFRRWVNHAWGAVEPEGQPRAGEWTPEDRARLDELVKRAHSNGHWIRFYALDGHSPIETVTGGWSPEYSFGSEESARIRWRAAWEAGVDFVACDQYEACGAFLKALRAEGSERE